jgi:hypothetical protein
MHDLYSLLVRNVEASRPLRMTRITGSVAYESVSEGVANCLDSVDVTNSICKTSKKAPLKNKD